jgi:acyl carrier protein
MNETLERIRTLLAAEFPIDRETIKATTPLTDLGVDSLAALEFVFVLEDTFQVVLDPATDLRGGMVQDLVDAVERAREPRLVANPAAA